MFFKLYLWLLPECQKRTVFFFSALTRSDYGNHCPGTNVMEFARNTIKVLGHIITWIHFSYFVFHLCSRQMCIFTQKLNADIVVLLQKSMVTSRQQLTSVKTSCSNCKVIKCNISIGAFLPKSCHLNAEPTAMQVDIYRIGLRITACSWDKITLVFQEI